MRLNVISLGLALLVWVSGSAPALAEAATPYRILRDAYAARAADQAASAFSDGATLIASRAPAESRSFRGRHAIRDFYAALFRATGGEGPLDLNFRVTGSETTAGGSRDVGYYRVRSGAAARTAADYGRFSATLVGDSDGTARISSARIHRSSEAEFEEARAPVLFAADMEELGSYYNALLGRYRRPDGCNVVITRTLRRLWARDACTLEWRSLARVSGREWTAGSRVISDEIESRYRFAGSGDSAPRRLRIASAAANGPRLSARRADPYRIEPISFRSPDGTLLAGQIWIPATNSRRVGIVLAHGSGPQDRNGYASFLAVLADALAERGYTVLTYDKRGAGRSEGDWSRASFATLGDDLAAGLAALRRRPDLVDPEQAGIGGSSQAGWISAKAIERGATPSFVFLVGAGGSAMPVTVQNRYNVGVSMRCAGFSEPQIATVLEQNEAFYAFRRDASAAPSLDAVTARAARDPALADWLLPDSGHLDVSGGAWYSVMEIDFDPVPVWRSFPGRLVFVQGDQDDQTPVDEVRERLAGISPRNLSLHILEGAQHLGLRAANVCEGSRLQDLSRFHPGLFEAIDGLGGLPRPDLSLASGQGRS